jgi:hypothetical protein
VIATSVVLRRAADRQQQDIHVDEPEPAIDLVHT